MKTWLQHNFNALHVYCRLRSIMPAVVAKRAASYWSETRAYSLMYN